MNLEPYIKILEECRMVGQIREMIYQFEQKHGSVEHNESLIKIKKILEETYAENNL